MPKLECFLFTNRSLEEGQGSDGGVLERNILLSFIFNTVPH